MIGIPRNEWDMGTGAEHFAHIDCDMVITHPFETRGIFIY